ncbi:outer membrane protein assembly factor BamA [Rapidithrix thailandica]|uniref:Outer membrane protein assembly factor BamA n=1 Tax=Rapidithrix thailandica TaxID=413964 RepID=A0AAW9SEW5_9BACT
MDKFFLSGTANKLIVTSLLLLSFLAVIPDQAQAQLGFQLNSGSSQDIDYGNPKEYKIADINVVGSQFNDKNSLISISGLKVGDKIRIPGDDISMAVRKLWKLGIVGDVKITVTKTEGNEVYLQIELTERPRLSRYFFNGVPKGQRETLSEKVNLIRGRIVTDALVKNARNAIINHYSSKGFKNCQVEITQEKDSLLANGVILHVNIDKKKKVKIHEIQFEGVTQVKEKKLRKKMKKTKEKHFTHLFTPSKFIDEEYRNDKKNIIEYYRSMGFRNATIVADSVYDHNGKMVNVKIKVDEGKKFYYRNITWTGNYKFNDEMLSRVLGVNRGDVYNPQELSKRLNFNPSGADVSSLYMDDGYLFFNVQPIEVLVEDDSIDIEMRMYEGEQATINKIIVNGNTKTSDHVIYRELRTIPGQKFSRTNLIRTQRELAALGYFDPETIEINPVPNFADGTVDIEYNVTERPSDQIELSGGWGGQFGFVGTLGLVFNNFSLRKITDLKAWRPLPAGDGQRLSLRLQANGRRFQTYSFSFTEPWLGGKRPNAFTVSLSRSIQRLIDYRTNRTNGSLKVTGITLGLGRRLKWPDDFFTMNNSVSFLMYNLDNFRTTGFGGYDNGRSYNITFNTTIARNSIDSPTFPRRGSQLSLSVSLTPPYSKFGGKEFGEPTEETKFKWVEYHKWMFDNSWFLPILDKLVLNARMHYGFIGKYTPSREIGPFERFILGGDGLSQNSFLLGTEIVGLRGYENNSILPFESNGTGGVAYGKYVLELRYGVSLNPAATIFVLSFLEAGNNWGSIDEFNPFVVKRSAGVGARVFMPAFGMLGVDWGYGFDNIPGNPSANGAQFHFTIGQQIR